MSSDWWQTYRDLCRQPLTVKRYTGAGVNRPSFETAVRGNARQFSSAELLADIRQGDYQVILLMEDLIAQQFALPVTSADKIVVDGKEISVIVAKLRKDLDGNQVAYECQCRG